MISPMFTIGQLIYYVIGYILVLSQLPCTMYICLTFVGYIGLAYIIIHGELVLKIRSLSYYGNLREVGYIIHAHVSIKYM